MLHLYEGKGFLCTPTGDYTNHRNDYQHDYSNSVIWMIDNATGITAYTYVHKNCKQRKDRWVWMLVTMVMSHDLYFLVTREKSILG